MAEALAEGMNSVVQLVFKLYDGSSSARTAGGAISTSACSARGDLSTSTQTVTRSRDIMSRSSVAGNGTSLQRIADTRIPRSPEQ